MITKYKIFESTQFESVEDFRNKLEKELSKYLKTETTNDFNYHSNINVHKKLIFLLEEDYGVRISNIINMYQFGNVAHIRSIMLNKDKNIFVEGFVSEFNSKDNLEEFVKKLFDKLKMQDKVRKIQKHNREIKKLGNKYNL